MSSSFYTIPLSPILYRGMKVYGCIQSVFLLGGNHVWVFTIQNVKHSFKASTKKQIRHPHFPSRLLPLNRCGNNRFTRRHIIWESRIATVPSELKENVQIEQGEQLITKEKAPHSEIRYCINDNTIGKCRRIFIQTVPVDLLSGK